MVGDLLVGGVWRLRGDGGVRMHGGGMGVMSMPLLPQWLRVVWVVALCVVVVVHVGHAWARPGQRRWWHTGHIVMAGGMALMYALPVMSELVWRRMGLALFCLATVTLAVVTVVLWRREGAVNPLWLFAGVDMFAMSYMLAPSWARSAWLTVMIVVYLVGQVAAWGFGLWDRLAVFRVGRAGAPSVGAVASSSGGGGCGPALLSADPDVGAGSGPALGLTGHSTPAVRLTLAVMAAGMAYMLAVM